MKKSLPVNLFACPRKFGKILNLSMLRYYFEDTGDAKKKEENKSLFQGLKIMVQGEKYTQQVFFRRFLQRGYL